MRQLQIALLSLILLAACQRTPSEQALPPIAAASSDRTVTPIVQPPTATIEVTSTATEPPTAIVATNTPQPTQTPQPSATPTVTKVPTSTPRPTMTATPVALYRVSEVMDAGRSRFTGELIEDEAIRNRRPIICKISNWEHEWVRPQSGLNSADIIFEHVTEGPITRFSALFHSQTPPNVGPVRSARLIDLELPMMYDAALCFSGASIGVEQRLKASEFKRRLIWSYWNGYYRSGEDKPWEHTFYAQPAKFWESLEEFGLNRSPETWEQMAFTEIAPEWDDCATNLNCGAHDYVWISYRKYTIVEWRYDAEIGKYQRWAENEPVIDKNDGEQVTASNVILLYAEHTLDESICEHQQDNKCYAGSTHMDLFGEGEVTILRDGQRYDGVWRRERPNEMLTFYGWNGEVIPLQLGNSWVQVIPYHYNNSVGWEEGTKP